MSGERGKLFAPRDYTGERFTKLVAVQPTGEKNKKGNLLWELRCDCGTTIIRSPADMKIQKSCGCLKKANAWRGPRVENGGAHVNFLFSRYRYSARGRGHEFHLTKEEARGFFEGDCHYCGAPPQLSKVTKSLAGEFAWNGIDREDSARGYEVSNCVSCCGTCNVRKGTADAADFRAWVERVHAHLVGGAADHSESLK